MGPTSMDKGPLRANTIMTFLLALAALPLLSAQHPLPKWEQTYDMGLSTVIMPCNYSGFSNPDVYANWGLVDFDWR